MVRLAVALFGLSAGLSVRAAETRPNILLIISDQHFAEG